MLLICICFCALIHTDVFGLRHYNLKYSKQHQISTIQLNAEIMASMGSDAIIRPEDEDSPEFKEYLKQLLKMQANRAKGGHAAPSSGSSDAYVAKLNRLKLEKLARFKAGLPDIPLDTSYKPEDYDSAIFEASEVPVSTGGILTLDAAPGGGGGGAKLRSLSPDEIRLAKLTEEKVRKELEESLKNNSNNIKTPTSSIKKNLEDIQVKPKPVTFESDFENELVSSMLGGFSSSSSSKSSPTSPQKKNVVEISRPQKVETIPATVVVPKSPTAAAVIPTPSTRNINTVSSSKAPVVQIQQSENKKAVVQKVRKLNKKELDIAGKALQMAVMHRGGGPFGAGRLQGEEAMQLADALNAAYEMLKSDASQATSLEIKPQNYKVIEDEVELPVLSSTLKSTTTINTTTTNNTINTLKTTPAVPSPEPLPVPTPKVKTEVPTTKPITAVAQSVAVVKQASTTTDTTAQPIALGLDRFLQNSQNMNFEELDALRDGLIQCLSLIQSTINSNRNNNNVDIAIPQPVAGTATDRMVDTYFNPEVSNTSGHSSTVDSGNSNSNTSNPSNNNAGAASNERDLKLALGLLLKHRGGPGFGHGRLEGSELLLMEKKLRTAAELLMSEATSLIST